MKGLSCLKYEVWYFEPCLLSWIEKELKAELREFERSIYFLTI